jgi:hypothetical protein
MKALLRTVALIAVLVAGIYAFVVRPWLVRWGADDSERSLTLPGDELVPEPKYETTHALTIYAPAEQVWRWLVQLGQGRGGFFSYDWIENLFRLDIHSVDRIVPELQSLSVGDAISLAPDNNVPMWVVTLEPPHAMVLSTGKPGETPVSGDYLKGELAGSWAFILQPLDDQSTRFIVRWRSDWQRHPLSNVLNTLLLEPAHCTMERGMMLGIKERAERNEQTPAEAA